MKPVISTSQQPANQIYPDSIKPIALQCEQEIEMPTQQLTCNLQNNQALHAFLQSVDLNEVDIQKIAQFSDFLQRSNKIQKIYCILRSPNKKLLFLDLDRTIVYKKKNEVIVRPYLKQLLCELHAYYNIYIFTAASASYTSRMLDVLEQKDIGSEHILGFLSRQNCVKVRYSKNSTIYVKDIRILLNLEPSQTVVVDDTPHTYCLNKDNGIPIRPFKGQDDDEELLYIKDILKELKDSHDVRQHIASMKLAFRL